MPAPLTLPLRVDDVAKVLTLAALELAEEADIFRRNCIPENFDNLLEAIQGAKRVIARAEEEWGLTP